MCGGRAGKENEITSDSRLPKVLLTNEAQEQGFSKEYLKYLKYLREISKKEQRTYLEKSQYRYFAQSANMAPRFATHERKLVISHSTFSPLIANQHLYTI